MITFGSVCSGIEAASVAWGPLGWKAEWFSEIEPFPCSLLAHHYPYVPNLGDMTAIPSLLRARAIGAPDVFCGGTPCQAFSVAGLRKSLADARGNLSLTFCEIADEIDNARAELGKPPAIIFWENVPGVLTTKDNAFGCFLAGLAGESDPLVAPGGRWTDAGCVLGPKRAVAWRTLDAQYFGLAQRRKRVFVVASAREGFSSAEILFEFDGVRRDSAPSRETGQEVAGTLSSRTTGGGGLGTDFDLAGGLPAAHPEGSWWDGGQVSQTLDAVLYKGQTMPEKNRFPAVPVPPVAYRTAGDGAVYEEGDRAAPLTTNTDRCADIVAFDTTQITSVANRSNPKAGDPCHPLSAGAHPPAIAFALRGRENGAVPEIHGDGGSCGALRAASGGSSRDYVAVHMVRRLLPVECERLQGFPDKHTDIPHRGKPAADGPRYKSLGNSWAIPCVSWIGARINAALP